MVIVMVRLWAIQVLRNAGGGGGIHFSGYKRYEGKGSMLLALRGGGLYGGTISRKKSLRNT